MYLITGYKVANKHTFAGLSDENPEQLGEAEGHRLWYGGYRICQAKAKRKIVTQFEGSQTFTRNVAVRDTVNRFNHWPSNKTTSYVA